MAGQFGLTRFEQNLADETCRLVLLALQHNGGKLEATRLYEEVRMRSSTELPNWKFNSALESLRWGGTIFDDRPQLPNIRLIGGDYLLKAEAFARAFLEEIASFSK